MHRTPKKGSPSLNLRLVFTLVASASMAAGCASGLHRIEDASLVEVKRGQDVEKFEVREHEVLPPAPVQAAPVSRQTKKLRVAKNGDTKPQGFVYPNRRPKKDPIRIGDKAVYSISYLGVKAGEFTMRTLPFKQINGRRVYHIQGEALSSKVFSVFYSLKDTIETFIDYESMSPHRFHVVLDESKQKRNSLELYDSEKGRSFFWNRWNHHKKGYVEIKDFFPMQAFSQDSLSSLFYLRTLDLPDGGVVTFPVMSEGQNWDAVVTVVRRETIDTPMGPMRAIVLKPETKYQGILKKQGDSFIWLSDDDRRWLLRLEAKVKIGTVVGEIRSLESGPESAAPAAAMPLPSATAGSDEFVPTGALKK